MLCRRIAVMHGMRWQDASLADIYPLLVDVANKATPEEETNIARRLTSLGILEEVAE